MSTIQILLIEDDIIDQMAFQRSIKSHLQLIQFQTASSVAEAKQWLAKEVFDWLIIDFHLGDGTAFDIIEQLDQQAFIVLTSHVNKLVEQQLLTAGAKAVLLKDIELNYLSLVMNHLNIPLPISIKEKTSTSSPFLRLYQNFDGDRHYIKEVFEVFLKENPLELKRLLAFEQENQYTKLSDLAHKLKSGYRMMGFSNVVNHLERLELINWSIQSEAKEGQKLIQTIQEESKKIHHLIQEEQKTLDD